MIARKQNVHVNRVNPVLCLSLLLIVHSAASSGAQPCQVARCFGWWSASRRCSSSCFNFWSSTAVIHQTVAVMLMVQVVQGPRASGGPPAAPDKKF